MEDVDIKEFDAFLERNWGIKPPKREDEIEAEEKAKEEANAAQTAKAQSTATAPVQKRQTGKPMTNN